VEQPPPEAVEQAPAPAEEAESVEKGKPESEEIRDEILDESGKGAEVLGTDQKVQEEAPEAADEKDLVMGHAVSLEEKVELDFDLSDKDDKEEKILTVDQTIDAIKKKTVECPKCGTMNYAIRWYCENCEATLTSL